MALSLPITLVKSIKRKLKAAARLTSSSTSGADQCQDWLGEWWLYELTFAFHTRDEGRAVGAFFNRLRGPSTPFLFADPAFQAQVGGSAAVGCTSANWLAGQLETSGWVANTSIPAGAFFNIGSGDDTRLYQVVEAATSNASGLATLVIAPRLRAPITSPTPLVFAAPKVLLRLEEEVPSEIEAAEIYTFSLRAKEAL